MKWFRGKDKKEQSPSFDEQRQHVLVEIGAKLRATREGFGFDLDDVVAYTKIARRLLQAIEEANFNNLPEPIYIQGLIRRYADALGLNGSEMSNSFPIGVNQVSLKPTWKSHSSGQLRPTHLYLIYVGIIFCSVSGLSYILNSATVANSGQSQEKSSNQASVSSNSNQESQRFSLQSVSNRQTNSTQVQEVQVGLTLKESSWVLVQVDGKTEFEGILPQGSKRTWKAQSQLTVKAGNAGGVFVSVNQEKPKPMGEFGKPEQVTVAANNRS